MFLFLVEDSSSRRRKDEIRPIAVECIYKSIFVRMHMHIRIRLSLCSYVHPRSVCVLFSIVGEDSPTRRGKDETSTIARRTSDSEFESDWPQARADRGTSN